MKSPPASCLGIALDASPYTLPAQRAHDAIERGLIGEVSLKRYLLATAGVALLFSTNSALPQVTATAGVTTPDLPYEAVPNFFQSPPGDYMGELQGVATNSK